MYLCWASLGKCRELAESPAEDQTFIFVHQICGPFTFGTYNAVSTIDANEGKGKGSDGNGRGFIAPLALKLDRNA
jgi:hypothetical protein